MGPYCRFCNMRCFLHITDCWPVLMRQAYGTSSIVATCLAGQAFEKKKVGYCYQDYLEAVELSGSTCITPYDEAKP